MTALDFPDTPAVGQTYGSAGTVWRWDGARWASTSGASGARGRVAYAQVTANTSGIVAAVNIAGLSVTWTADPARTYRTTVFAEVFSSAGGDTPIVWVTDAAGNGKVRVSYHLPVPNVSATFTGSVVESGLSGPITRQVQVLRALGTGTLTFQANPAWPAFILVEDITYEAGSSAGTGEWRSFTPRLTAGTTNPNLGTAPNSIGRVSRFGNTVNWAVSITPGGTGVNAGSGFYLLDIPFPPHSVSGKFSIVGHGWIYGATGFKILTLDVTSVVTCRILKTDGAQLGEADGLTTAGSVLAVSGSYEAA